MSPRRILVVEDAAAIRAAVEDTRESAGPELVAVDDGVAAVLRHDPPGRGDAGFGPEPRGA